MLRILYITELRLAPIFNCLLLSYHIVSVNERLCTFSLVLQSKIPSVMDSNVTPKSGYSVVGTFEATFTGLWTV